MSGIDAETQAYIQRAKKTVTIKDLIHNPSEMVEACRHNAQASLKLQECTQRIIESEDNPGIIDVANGVLTALRANVRFMLAYHYHIHKRNPEHANITIEQFIKVYHMAVIAYQSGGAEIHNGYVISSAALRKTMNDVTEDNARWIGAHVTAICILESLVRKMGDAIELVKSDMPKGYSSLFSVLKIRINQLFTSSRKKLDEQTSKELFRIYPFAKDEWKETGNGGTQHCENIVYQHLHKQVEITHKTLVLAMQKVRQEQPHVKAYLYMILHIVTDIIDMASNLENKEDKEHKFREEPSKASFHKEWNGVLRAAGELRDKLTGKQLTISGEYATLAMEKCESLSEDITEAMPLVVVRRADMAVIVQYADLAIACMMKRIRTNKGLPLSWVVALRKLMGNRKDFRKLIGQMRNPKLLSDMPMDDLQDAGEYITEHLADLQEILIDKQKAQIMVQDPDDETMNCEISRILLLRRYITCHLIGPIDYIPKEARERTKNTITRTIYKDGGVLSDRHMQEVYVMADNKADLMRMLKEIGPMGKATLRKVKNKKVTEFDRDGEVMAVEAYRQRGYDIQPGMERLFIHELRLMGKDKEIVHS